MKVLSLFSGIGAFEKALDNLEIPYELIGYCEIDKYASKSYASIHNVDESMNLGDITKVNEKKLPKDIDLITYGFPCQDISLAGKQKGLFNEDGTQTRSGLFFEALRIIEKTQPRVAIAENVKNLTSKKFSEQFKIVLDSLEQAGYNNYWQVLNAKDYGIPQNRERVFIVSIRKDIDTGLFQFPQGFPLELRLKDMLEDEVDEKYYINTERASFLIQQLIETNQVQNERVCCDSTINEPKVREISNCITSRYNAGIQNQKQIGLCVVEPQSCVLVKEATKKGYAEAVEGDSINFEQPNSKTRRGRVGHGVAQTLTTLPQQGVVVNEPTVLNPLKNKTPYGWHFEQNVYDEQGITRALKAGGGSGNIPKVIVDDEPKIKVIGNYSPSNHDASRIVDKNGIAPTVKENHGTVTATMQNLRIRKLTPKECFLLQGFDDESFMKAEKNCSNTQLYKQAGNSICVPVIEHIIKGLFDCKALKKEESQISFNDAETFNEVVKACQKGR